MDEIIAHIEELSKLSPYIKMYRNFDPKIILKHIGKITGEIDRQRNRLLGENLYRQSCLIGNGR